MADQLPQPDGSSPLEEAVADLKRFLARYEHLRPYLWRGELAPAFWTVSGVFSLGLNVILIIILVVVGRELFALKSMVRDQLIGGLHANFMLMDQAVISAVVPVEDEIPVQFTLPVRASTTVVLTEDTFLPDASVDLTTGGLSITNAPTDITLPAGTELPVNLSIDVPVDTMIPVELEVDVRIPLRDTQLHAPFVGLQNVVSPYNSLLSDTPDSWGEALCPRENGFCRLLRR